MTMGPFMEARYPEEATKRKHKTKIGQHHEVNPVLVDIEIEIEEIKEPKYGACDGSNLIPEIVVVDTGVLTTSIIVISGTGFCAFGTMWRRSSAHAFRYDLNV